MTDEDRQVVDAMARYGGSFAQALAKAAMVADALNLERIKSGFPTLWEKYLYVAQLKQRQDSHKDTHHENE